MALAGSVFMPAIKRAAKVLGLPLSESTALASAATAARPLKACVVYYSATGSTGKVAGAIHRGMKSVMACDVAPIKKMDPKTMVQYDVIAVGGPIWYFRETANLRLFVYDMPPMDGKLCVPFCTHGTNPDGFFYSLSTQILKKGLKIIGWNDWYGGCSHVLHQPSPYFTDGHPDEIDLKEAETFGREMAECALRIYAGETNLIPDIPAGPDADSLWVPLGYDSSGGMPGMEEGMPPGEGMPGMGGDMPEGSGGGAPRGMPGNPDAATMTPTIDLDKCIYPRCTACIDNCLVDAIDLSLSVQGARVSESKFLVKEACLHCSHPLCEKACDYDAITFDNGTKTEHVFDMNKCTYPKCTLCVDECPMDSIDFSRNPPHIKRNCEGCDVCWCVCPEDAISIPNLATTHALLQPTGPEDGFFADLNEAEKTGRFRRLVPLDQIGWDNIVMNNPKAPRVVLKPGNYPYEVSI
jgi:flavodoxin/ferredoxin